MQMKQQSALINETKSNNNLKFHHSNTSSKSMTSFQSDITSKYEEEFVQFLPNIKEYNWEDTIKSMIEEMIQSKDINFDSFLFINDLNDFTNGLIDVIQATKIMYTFLKEKAKFLVASINQIKIAKKNLGLSLQDNLISLSKAISIARNMKAKYVIYSNAIRKVNTLKLQIQLILVKTGEIIWSGEDVIPEKQS